MGGRIPPGMPTLEERLEALEKRVRTLEEVVSRLSESMNTRVDHKMDRETVRERTKFDWQS